YPPAARHARRVDQPIAETGRERQTARRQDSRDRGDHRSVVCTATGAAAWPIRFLPAGPRWKRGSSMTAFNNLTRRHFFATGARALGTAALGSLLGEALGAEGKKTHFTAKAKHVIYLHMVGGPPQMDLYDYKPKMQEFYDKDLPDSIRQ